MKSEVINKIKNISEHSQLISITDIKNKLEMTYATAQLYILEMEILGILERVNHKAPESTRTFKFWRLKKQEIPA